MWLDLKVEEGSFTRIAVMNSNCPDASEVMLTESLRANREKENVGERERANIERENKGERARANRDKERENKSEGASVREQTKTEKETARAREKEKETERERAQERAQERLTQRKGWCESSWLADSLCWMQVMLKESLWGTGASSHTTWGPQGSQCMCNANKTQFGLNQTNQVTVLSLCFNVLSFSLSVLPLSLSHLTLTHSHTHTHSLSLVLVVMMKSKELKTKIYSHADSLILSLILYEIKGVQDQDLFSCSFSDSLTSLWHLLPVDWTPEAENTYFLTHSSSSVVVAVVCLSFAPKPVADCAPDNGGQSFGSECRELEASV